MNEELYIRFENYLSDEMTSEEKTRFEVQLKKDTSIIESFELYKETTNFLENKFSDETIEFLNNLKSISAQHFSSEKETKVITFKPWYYAIAASVVLVIGVWMTMQNDPSYNDYNQHDTAVFVERSNNNENLKLAQEAFNNKEYKKAIEAFDKISDLRKPELQYYYAIALIETDNYSKAELFLDQLREGNSAYKEKASWYLALSYLKQDKKEECKLILSQISSDGEDYDKAQQLLNDLE